MSCGSYGLTVKELEGLISYPPRVKKQPKAEPHCSAESRRLLEQYHASVAASAKDRARTKMANVGIASQRNAVSDGCSLLEDADRAELQGRIDEALSCLLEAVRIGDGNAVVQSKIGCLFMAKDNPADALEYLTNSIALDPLESANYLHRAECFIALDDPAAAFAEFEKFFKLEEPPKHLLVRCGKCALDADLLDSAEGYLRQALDRCEVDAPNDAYAWYNLGELAEKRGDDQAAQEHYRNVCVADPTFPAPYMQQAEDEFASGNSSMALHLFEAVAKMTPADPHVYVRLADVYESLGPEFFTSVLTCLSKAVELSAGCLSYEQNIVRRGVLLLDVFGDVEQSITDFTLCLESNPANPNALEHRARALRARGGDGDADAAVADYQALIDIPTVSWHVKAEPLRFLAVHAMVHGEPSRAAKLFALASLHGATEPGDELLRFTAMAQRCIQQGLVFDEAYEPRGPTVKENEKGAKKGEISVKAAPVPSLLYLTIDAFYVRLRDREPTVHSAEECAFIGLWKTPHDEVERAREEAETLRAGKRGAKRK